MKASELAVGTTVAVTDGVSKYDQRTNKATQCEVIGAPENGEVRVKLLEDAKSRMGNRRIWGQSGWMKEGDTTRVQTRACWMLWETLGVRAENERAAKETAEREEKETEDRLAELQRRTDQFAGEVDESLRWGGLRRSFDRTRAGEQEYVRIPTHALEALLDKAEGR
jgi:hypothetical protein